MYDPVTSHMLAPDNFVQTSDFSQKFNRYSYALNNPLMFTDPDGEFIIEAMMIGAFINAAIQTATVNVNNVGDFFLAAGIGAVSGTAGAGVGGAVANAVGTIGFAGGAITGAAGGFAGGFTGTAGNAWGGGANFRDGLMAGLKAGGIGALTGGIVGGFARGISDYRKGYDFWNGSKVDEFIVGSLQNEKIASSYNSSVQADINDELLKMRYQDEFGIREGDFNIQDITTRTGKGYGMDDKSGIYINLKSKNMVGGYVRNFSTGYSDIHISPFYSNGDAVSFRAIAGHELIHAYHYFALPSVNTIYTERVAYKYTYDVYYSAGRFSSAFSTLNTAMWNSGGSFRGLYPLQYQIPSPYRFY
jgi:hypothetical protein